MILLSSLYLFIADTYMHQFTLMDKQSSPERSAKDKNDLSSMELQLLPPVSINMPQLLTLLKHCFSNKEPDH